MARLRWLLPLALVLVWLGSAAPLSALGSGLTELQENDIAAFLPDSAESTRVQNLLVEFQPVESIPAVLLWENPDGIDEATLAAIGERLQAATDVAEEADALAAPATPLIPSEDGEAVQAFLPLEPDLSNDLLPVVEDIRAAIELDGTDSFVTGPAGIFADFSSVFEGIDSLLILAAFGIVLLILLVVYRSPILPFLVIATAGLALTAANAVAFLLADDGVITVNGQSQGIAAILVVGAATDYGLLLVARFREELRLEESKYTAMWIALRQSWEPIVASGTTVVLGVLCLLLSDLGSNRGLGPDLGGERHPRGPGRAQLPARRAGAAGPRRVLAVPAPVRQRDEARPWLGAGRPARGPPSPAGAVHQRGRSHRRRRLRAHLRRRRHPDLRRHPGRVERGGRAGGTRPALRRRFGQPDDHHHARGELAGGRRGGRRDRRRRLRRPVHRRPAAALRRAGRRRRTRAAGRDPGRSRPTAPRPSTPSRRCGRRSTTPIPRRSSAGRRRATSTTGTAPPATCGSSCRASWLVVLLVLALLLRSLVAPVLLVATVVLSVGATVGVAALLFDDVFGFPGSDPAILLIAFVFLVALGIDYNIFLMTRAREESARHGTKGGVLRALAVTGGVITRAGLVLAATFGALAVLPLLFLAQMAFLVGFGVLLDTFVVRSLVVPAAVSIIGDPVWWPSRLSRRSADPEPERELEPV